MWPLTALASVPVPARSSAPLKKAVAEDGAGVGTGRTVRRLVRQHKRVLLVCAQADDIGFVGSSWPSGIARCGNRQDLHLLTIDETSQRTVHAQLTVQGSVRPSNRALGVLTDPTRKSPPPPARPRHALRSPPQRPRRIPRRPNGHRVCARSGDGGASGPCTSDVTWYTKITPVARAPSLPTASPGCTRSPVRICRRGAQSERPARGGAA